VQPAWHQSRALWRSSTPIPPAKSYAKVKISSGVTHGGCIVVPPQRLALAARALMVRVDDTVDLGEEVRPRDRVGLVRGIGERVVQCRRDPESIASAKALTVSAKALPGSATGRRVPNLSNAAGAGRRRSSNATSSRSLNTVRLPTDLPWQVIAASTPDSIRSSAASVVRSDGSLVDTVPTPSKCGSSSNQISPTNQSGITAVDHGDTIVQPSAA
jgi:hypothetical protein